MLCSLRPVSPRLGSAEPEDVRKESVHSVVLHCVERSCLQGVWTVALRSRVNSCQCTV